MITEIDKNLWDFDSNIYYRVITTNGIIKKDRTAVMGKGIALQANQKYSLLSLELANHINNHGNVVGIFPKYKIITFPTKNHWKDDSTYQLIEKSCEELYFICTENNINKIVMPKVGCSNGRLEWNKVRKIIYEKLSNTNLDVIISRF